jgi:predicted nucleic acid-binding protein
VIVVDASAAVLALLNDGDARARLANEALAVPHLADSEIVQALRSQVRRGDIVVADAQRALDVWAQLGMQRVGLVGLLRRMWDLRENLTAYDASYVAVAEALECTLLTADARLAGAPGPNCSITVITD